MKRIPEIKRPRWTRRRGETDAQLRARMRLKWAQYRDERVIQDLMTYDHGDVPLKHFHRAFIGVEAVHMQPGDLP